MRFEVGQLVKFSTSEWVHTQPPYHDWIGVVVSTFEVKERGLNKIDTCKMCEVSVPGHGFFQYRQEHLEKV